MAQGAPSGLASSHELGHQPDVGRPGRSAVVNPRRAESGFNPPQQARSRAALQRLLASAEDVLVNDGVEDFTIARVAEHAGVSVGGVYRRFASKEQLIDAVKQALVERLEQAVAEALDKAEPSLRGVLEAFTTALSETLNESGRVITAVLAGGRSVGVPEQGLRTVISLQERFLDAAAPHQDQIRHPDPPAALMIAFRSMTGAGAHRAATSSLLPDGLTWRQWAREIADMTTAYLTVQRQKNSSAR
jgi:AcrR family transcriptional regulator